MATTSRLEPATVWAEYLGTIEAVIVLLVRVAVIGYALALALREQFDDLRGHRPIQRQPKALLQLPPAPVVPAPVVPAPVVSAPPAQPRVIESEPLVLRETTPEGVQRYSRMTDQELSSASAQMLRSMARAARDGSPERWTLATPIHLATKKQLVAALRQLRSTTSN